MTRKKYIKLRGTLYTEFKKKYGNDSVSKMTRQQYNARPNFIKSNFNSYQGAWDSLKAARDLVNM